MCKFISSDSVIGNFVIEILEKNDDFRIELTKLYAFDAQLSERLKEHNYYTKFENRRVLDFKDDYPFFIESLDKECFSIVNSEKKPELKSMLIRYFRVGLPKIVIEEMKTVSKTILE